MQSPRTASAAWYGLARNTFSLFHARRGFLRALDRNEDKGGGTPAAAESLPAAEEDEGVGPAEDEASAAGSGGGGGPSGAGSSEGGPGGGGPGRG